MLKTIPKKFLKKVLKKVLTKVEVCDKIVKLSAERVARSLKIEQQERSTKHCKCNTDLVRVY